MGGQSIPASALQYFRSSGSIATVNSSCRYSSNRLVKWVGPLSPESLKKVCGAMITEGG